MEQPAPPALSEEQLTEVVGRFYARVRRDAVLGPVFEGAVEDWNRHLHTLVAFWSSVVNGSGRYRGSPMQAHAAHAGLIEPAMFDRWLALWRETTARVLPPAEAALMQERAERMAVALRKGIA
jgi:hemoglobin